MESPDISGITSHIARLQWKPIQRLLPTRYRCHWSSCPWSSRNRLPGGVLCESSEQSAPVPRTGLRGRRPQQTQQSSPRTTALFKRNRVVVGQAHRTCGTTKRHPQAHHQTLVATYHVLLPQPESSDDWTSCDHNRPPDSLSNRPDLTLQNRPQLTNRIFSYRNQNIVGVLDSRHQRQQNNRISPDRVSDGKDTFGTHDRNTAIDIGISLTSQKLRVRRAIGVTRHQPTYINTRTLHGRRGSRFTLKQGDHTTNHFDPHPGQAEE